MKAKFLIYILLSSFLGFAFTVLIYNFKFLLDFIYALYDNQVLIHIGVTLFYFCLYLFLKKKLPFKNIYIILICILTPLIIDASVLITNRDKIPLRFPFSSLFPILGVLLAEIKLNSKKYIFLLTIFGYSLFFILCYKLIIPKIMYYSFEKSSSPIKHNIFSEQFLTINNNKITLGDTSSAKCNLIECFFKGCIPCEQKKIEISKIRTMFNTKQLNIVYICDGSITTYEDFLQYSLKNMQSGVTFLYDGDSILPKKLEIKGYPFELLCKEQEVTNTLLGFDEIISTEYLNSQKIKIQKNQNEKDTD